MISIVATEEYKKVLRELPIRIQQKLLKAEKLFKDNPFHPSLNTEKLQPKENGPWSFRIDRAYRVIFKFRNGHEVAFLTIGHHNWIYNFLFL